MFINLFNLLIKDLMCFFLICNIVLLYKIVLFILNEFGYFYFKYFDLYM